MVELREVKGGSEHYFVDANGLRQGVWRDLYRNGEVAEEGFYLNNEFHGECKAWYPNGQMSSLYSYVNGMEEGEFKRWFANGQILEQGFIVARQYHGERKNWGADGQLYGHFFFNKGFDITSRVIELVDNMGNITSEERMLIKLKYGIDCLLDVRV